MQVTLNKANNLKARLKKEVGGGRESMFQSYGAVNDFTVEVEVPLNTPKQAIDELFTSEIIEARKEYQKKLNYASDFVSLKESILQGNVASGLSGILSAIVKQKNLLKNAEQALVSMRDIKSKSPADAHSYIEAEKALIGENKKASVQIYLKIHTSLHEVQDLIKVLRKTLSDLEDQKFKINNEYKIDIDLSKDSMEFLGIE